VTSGSIGTGPTGNVRVRLVNALTSSQSLNFLIDNQVAASGVAFGGASSYVSVAEGSHRLQAQASATGTTLLDFTQDLNAAGAFSLIPAPGLSSSGALFLPDDPTPVAGQVKVRVVHVAAAPGPISVYVTSPTADLTSATPIAQTLNFGAASTYVVLAPGSYRVRVTPAGVPSTILIDSGTLNLGASSVRTFLLTDSPGGGLPTILSAIADAG
jgi:hypothetical protein